MRIDRRAHFIYLPPPARPVQAVGPAAARHPADRAALQPASGNSCWRTINVRTPGRTWSSAIRLAALPRGRGHPGRTDDRGYQLLPPRWQCAGGGPAGINGCWRPAGGYRRAGPLVHACRKCRGQRLAPARRRGSQARTEPVGDDSLRGHRQVRPSDDDPCRQTR